MAGIYTTDLTIDIIYIQYKTTYRRTTRVTTAESRRMPATRISTKLGVRLQIQRQGTERHKAPTYK